MTRDSRYDILFEPIRIGPVTARNRFYQVPHCNGMGYRDVSALAAMRGMKAEGGWGVVCTEQVEFHYSSDITPFIELTCVAGLAISARQDARVRQRSPRMQVEYPLASLISQALGHSTEHRAQIAAIITQLGLEPPDMSGWAYMEEAGELIELGEST